MKSGPEERYRRRMREGWDRVAFGTHCVNCFPGNCPLYVFVKDGRVVFEEAAGILEAVEPGVPDMNPLICQKGLAWSRELDNADRLTHPLRRSGERGEGRWEQISWDDALAEVADAMLDAIEREGPESILMEMSPEISTIVPSMRFMQAIGGTLLDVNATINDFWTGYQQVFGKSSFAPSEDDVFHADCMFIWHANPAHTRIPTYHYMVEARYHGARIVLISPDVSPSHSHVDFHLPLRHGTDAALALGMCQVVLAEGRADLDFVRSQTDLSLLVRCDNGCFLRTADLDPDGRDDRFYQADSQRRLVPADPATLSLDFEPLLEGVLTMSSPGGESFTVEPLFARVRRLLDAHYTPEFAASICDTHPDNIRRLARLAAAGRTRILLGAGVTKYYHGDLMVRSILLLLALTGNWGRKGSGISGWCSSLFDGHLTAMAKTEAGRKGAADLLGGVRAMAEMARQQDPTLSPELAQRAVWRALSSNLGSVPPAFHWYHHAGYRERWSRRDWNDPTMRRPFDDYWNEACTSGAWGRATTPSKPRVLLEIGGNTLRRTRGGKGTLIKHLWPRLEKIVCMDYRMSQTALHADIVLPATQHHEKSSFGMPTPWTMFLAMSDTIVDPPGQARSEWPVLAELCRVVADRARQRGSDSFPHRDGTAHRFDQLWDAFTLRGVFAAEESAAEEMIQDAVASGNLPPGTSRDTFRQRGITRYAAWATGALVAAQASPFPHRETHAPLRDHVESAAPYPTLTRRAQFLIDHPWYREAGEDLPMHKDPPAMGGNYPFRLSGGHSRWSVHAMNMTNPVLLETHRGKPFVLINSDDARRKGIEDDAPVRVWNDVGEFVVPALLSPAQRPGALTVYNGFEGFMFSGGSGSNEVEPGMIKWLHLVGDYGHLHYTPTEWQPVPFDRCISVDCEKEKSR